MSKGCSAPAWGAPSAAQATMNGWRGKLIGLGLRPVPPLRFGQWQQEKLHAPAFKGSQPLARQGCHARLQGQGGTRSQSRADKTPHSKQRAPSHALLQSARPRSSEGTPQNARKRPAEEQPPQPLPKRARNGNAYGNDSEAQHRQEHAEFTGCCIRCDVQQRPKVYEACALQEGKSWLASGISKRDGLWGLGCSACAEYLASGRTCRGAKFNQEFANFQVRPKSRWTAKYQIEQHLESKAHRVASGISRTRLGRIASPRSQPLASPIACSFQQC